MLFLIPLAFAKEAKIPAIGATSSFAWYGVDYSAVSFMIPETFDEKGRMYPWVATMGMYYTVMPTEQRQIDTPQDAIDAFARSANDLVQAELLGDLKDMTKKEIVVRLPTKTGPSAPSGEGRGFGTEGSVDPANLDEAKVAAMVATWPAGEGVGLAFIADRISKKEEKGCFWPVVFDAASHQVHWTRRVCGELSGYGMRNYYFHPVKEVVEALNDARKKEW